MNNGKIPVNLQTKIKRTTTHMKEQKNPNPENLMTINDYAQSMGKSRRMIYYWIDSGIVELIPFLGKQFIDTSTFRTKEMILADAQSESVQ